MMFQDIDESKRREIALIERSERDTLTKAFNREAFMRRVDESIKRSGETDVHAFFMLDVDGFKTVNDLYGHGVGDETLTDIVRHMYSILRKEDLVGRMGGDEFAVFLKDASYDSIIEKRAQQICALMHRRIKEDTEISGSVGIAQFPRDGRSFVQLYHNADIALYAAKENGKNNYQFFQSNMQYPTDGHACTHTNTMAPLDAHTTETQCRKRLLIIDDAAPNRELCAAILKNEYVVRTAQNGETALAHLKRYGNSISVVLLSTWMDGMDGFAVLREIMCNQTLRSIPVIMFGQDKEEETALAAIELGAANFISAPIHAKRLRMCVQSAIRRGEQDKARLQNSYALLQEEEEARYRSVLTGTGTVVFEYDWINNVFTYDPLASQYLFGTYDDRPFWRILSTDGVADVEDVKAMQNCVLRISRDCNVQSDQMKVRLKAANACMHWFRMNVMRSSDVQGLMHKLLLIFNDINEEEIAQEKLRQRAERDPLTGLYNRETFLQKTRELLFAHGSKEYVVIYYDINRFKAINEMFGRTEGDAFLCHIARFMEKSLGKRGVCGRISADNFALCAPNEAAFLQEHLLKDCHAAFARYHLPFSITASFGVYVAEAPFISVDAMLDRAALAQKSVKKN
ncbi:MAG: diguanylate cyclase, partial [Clostridia bacterium]